MFFGGGTPSRLSPEQVATLIAAAHLGPGAEVSIECNPEDVTPDRLEGYVAAGITRASFGIQSTQPKVLAALGRRHGTGALAQVAAAAGTAGLTSWSIDLIYGAAGSGVAEVAADLDAVVGLEHPPPHVAAYALTVEAGTPLARDPARHPDEDVQAACYAYLDERLQGEGYELEEISNWARPGHRCRHHQLYWEGGDYLGIGAGAHGHVDGRRWWNVGDPGRYVERVAAGDSPEAGAELLDGPSRRLERQMLELRTAAGVERGALEDDPLLEGLVEERGERVVLTRRGRLLYNQVAARLRG